MNDLMMALFMKRGMNARLDEQIWLEGPGWKERLEGKDLEGRRKTTDCEESEAVRRRLTGPLSQ